MNRTPSLRGAAWPAGLAALVVLTGSPLRAQDPTWERAAPPTTPPPTVFHATQGLNLPTATTPGRGEFLFEIAHRFVPPIRDAEDALFGLDGPVRYRLGLGYGITDALWVRLTRSNVDDNLDLSGTWRLLEGRAPLSFQIAVAGGVAWNTEVPGVDGGTTQAHGELILNAALGRRVALGVVPAVVSNPLVRVEDEDVAFSVGLMAQVYLTDVVSFVGEWTITEERFDPASATEMSDPASLSVELETGGHFFRIGVTNSLRLNPAQYFVGASQPFEADEWRLAFNITRVLRF
ncbi:MAG TPA: DUF5777 family beta-barrel protein [Longimicrobiales bacterium]|nr:DUF5777 family beta-barrel protein [Longimicrobiales bacterium]